MEHLTQIQRTLAILVILVPWGAGASAQTPWNRELQTIAVLPDGAVDHTVHALWTVDVEAPSTPLDLSTKVELRINGTTVATQGFSVGIDAGSGLGCGTGPPCNGACGSGTQGGDAMWWLFEADGRHVKTLLERTLGAGRWSVTWDGRTEAGAPAPAGTCFYKLSLGERSETRKMTLLR